MGYEDVFRNGAETLREACFGIKGIIPSSEKDFLAIGDHLSAFADKAGRICETAFATSQLLGTDSIKDTTAKMRQILEFAASGAGAAQDALKENIATLQGMIAQINKISMDLNDFSRYLKRLRVLGISTRIESSRFLDARFRFESLADEVARSASVIELRHKEMCTRMDILSAAMVKVLEKALKTDGSQHTNAALIMEKLSLALDHLKEKQASASMTMESLSIRSNDLVANISQVIMSLQFHDICRQQMEHVDQTVEDLILLLKKQAGLEEEAMEQDASLGSSCASAHRICRLQLAQLSYTKETIVEAVQRIADSMDNIADSIDSMNHDIRTMLSSEDDEGESYLLRLEEGAEQVLSLLDENRKTEDQLGNAICSVRETSASISESVLAIQDIVDDIKLLSLNARIKAAMAGQEGRSVSVLSEAIERLAGDMNKVSDDLSCSFSTLLKGASELGSRGETAGCRVDEGTGQLLSELESIRLESAEVNGKAMNLLSGMGEEAGQLADSIRSVTRNEISVHRGIASSIEDVATLIQQVMDDLGPLAGSEALEEGAEPLGCLQDRYTMESERQIHRGQTVDMSPILYDQADTFGDNVELF
jgi:methyl-accepting chemotaxis protein